MSIRAHIIFMLLATVFAWASWFMVLFNINPDEGAWWGFCLFYLTLFFSLFGSLVFLGFVLRSMAQLKRMTTQYRVWTSFRQALLWSLALVIALALQGQRLLSWWIFLLLLIIFILIEFSLVSLQRYQADK